MHQQNKLVSGEYIVEGNGVSQRIEIEYSNGFMYVKNVYTSEFLLQCTPNKSANLRGISTPPKYRVKIEVEAIN